MAMPVIPLSADSPSAGSRTWMHFYGANGDSLWLLTKGALLTIPTLGFYRFWLITKLRRFLWQHTRIGEDSFEYLGTAKELLLGFLIAMAVLVPFYVLYFLASLAAEEVQVLASLPLIAIVFLLVKFAEFRARRYRLTRTAFRGVRFSMTGSGVRYAALWAGWSVVSLVTLGLALPWQIASLERYKVNNTRWGDLKARFEGTGWELFKQGIHFWALSVGLLIVMAGYVLAYRLQAAVPDPQLVSVLSGALFLIAPFAVVLFVGLQWRWWLSGLRLGAMSLTSHLPISTVLTRYLLLSVVTSAVLAGIAALTFVVVMLIGFEAGGLHLSEGPELTLGKIAVIGGAALAYVAVLLGMGVLNRQILVCGFWRIVVNSIQITNIEVLDSVAASGKPSSYVAEGFAEALDVGAF